jgi:PKD repeat protein
VHLIAHASAPGRRIVSYRWTFGGGAGRRRARPETTRAWTRIGNYTVTVTATDSWGDRVTARRSITIG